jgi:hypothetical protein
MKDYIKNLAGFKPTAMSEASGVRSEKPYSIGKRSPLLGKTVLMLCYNN